MFDYRNWEVSLNKPLTANQLEQCRITLQQLGFELLDANRKQQIEKIKSIIINHIHYLEDDKFIFSNILAKDLNKEYSQ